MARGRNGQGIPRLKARCIVMRECRNSTNDRIADGTIVLRNIDRVVKSSADG
ncbi:MAG: hypothetical protein J6J06_01000 [Bacteroidaceae bacterium]|nr:hypothetical protein [Bacteroidaceae bacterium]